MYKKISYVVLMMLLLLCIITPKEAYAVKGADISTLTTQEETYDVVYRENGVAKDPLTILKNHGMTLARIRLFVNPNTSDDGTKMNLAYVTALAARCKSAGMQVMLTLHYSDTWADPGAQTKPAAWSTLTQEQLVSQVYDYTYSVCNAIKPDYTQIGNEISCGMLWPNGNACEGNWANLRALITAGHNGAKAGGGGTTIVHVAESSAADLKWFFDNLLASSVSFDTIGLSYYPEYHGDIANFDAINTQAKSYGKGAIVCEMADYYTGVAKATETTQAAFVTNVLAINSNAIYWEPCWLWNSPVGYKALFKPISENWQNVEMTLALSSFDNPPLGPIYQAAGAVVSGTGAITPAWPTHQSGDVALLIVESANQAISLSTPAGFAEVTNSPQGTGTAAGTAATRLAVYWKRATTSAEAQPTVADSGDHQIARIITFRGVIASGNPWDVTAGNVASSASTSVSIPGVTTTVANTLVVTIVANATDTSSARTSGWTNTNLASLTERVDSNTKSGNGGGFGVATGVKATAGATGNTTATLATSSVQGRMSIALKP